jgi:hypothetical protein
MTLPPSYREQAENCTWYVDTVPEFEPGSQPPTGYVQWHEWARAQVRHGIRQRKCKTCGLWRFPQEKCCASHAPRGDADKETRDVR